MLKMLERHGFKFSLSFLLLLQITKATEFLPCSFGTGPLPQRVIIEGCEKLPCRFQRGSNISSQVEFTAPFNANRLVPILNVQVGQVWMNFDAGQRDGCESLVGPQCPLREGQTYVYQRKMPVQKGYPKIRIKVEHEMVDLLRRPVFCYGIVGIVVN